MKHVRKRLADGSTKFYWWHRATGTRIVAEPFSAAALLEVQALDQRSERLNGALASDRARSLGALWNDYIASPEWKRLKDRTRSDYQGVRDWVGDAAWSAMPAKMAGVEVLALRNKGLRERGRRFANYIVQVLRLVMN